MTKEQKQLMREMKEMGDNLKAAGIDFIIALNTGEAEQTHNISVRINVEDDHHMMDMLCGINECWYDANHSGR